MYRKKFLLVVAACIAAVMLLVGCGANSGAPQANNAQPVADFNADSQSTCFTQLNDEQRAQLQQYAAQHGDQSAPAGNNADGTQTICVLEDDGQGGYNQHYYKQEEQSNFSDYFWYSMLLGHSNTLMAYGLMSGDLDVGDAIALSLLAGVNNQGQMFRPYSYDSETKYWGRRPAPIGGNLRSITFGAKAPPRPAFDNSKMLQVPADFQSPLPKATDRVVELKKDARGKSVKASEKVGAKAVIEERKKAARQSAQPAVPRQTQAPAPVQSSGTGKSGTTTKQTDTKKVEPKKPTTTKK